MLTFHDGLKQFGLPFPDFETPVVLLPLLRPHHEVAFASAPPALEDEYLAAHRRPRIAFTSKDGTPWVATVHILPAAYPRTHDAATSPPSKPLFPLNHGVKDMSSAKQARDAQWQLMKDLTKDILPPTYYPPTTAFDAEIDAERRRAARHPQLWSVVERIVPLRSAAEQAAIDREGQPGLTVVTAHANGFHKETFEPFFQALVDKLFDQTPSSSAAAVRIDELWSIDTIDSGDSGLLNRNTLGRVVHWHDHPRDILNFLRYYIPKPIVSMLSPQQGKQSTVAKGIKTGTAAAPNPELRPTWPPRHLPRLGAGEGLKGRRIVLMGHSFSGNAVGVLSTLEPKLTERSFCIDPVILSSKVWEHGFIGSWPWEHLLGKGAAIRQEFWPSTESARKVLGTKPFLSALDPRALDLYIRFAIRSIELDPSASSPNAGPQTLSMNKWRETEACSSNWVARYAWTLLERHRNSPTSARSPLHLFTMSESRHAGIYSEEEDSVEQIHELIAAQTAESSAKELMGGHMVVQQQPELLAAEVAAILQGRTTTPAASQKAKL